MKPVIYSFQAHAKFHPQREATHYLSHFKWLFFSLRAALLLEARGFGENTPGLLSAAASSWQESTEMVENSF